MTQKLIRLALFSILFLGLTGCGQYDGWVRYPCQEHENWDKPECNPPECVSTGTCTKDIYGDTLDTEAKP